MRYFFLRYAILRDFLLCHGLTVCPALGSASCSARLEEFVANRHSRKSLNHPKTKARFRQNHTKFFLHRENSKIQEFRSEIEYRIKYRKNCDTRYTQLCSLKQSLARKSKRLQMASADCFFLSYW
ncbi:hypothetical protein L596_007893 [Steinernema carpocapsae]|uniref:Secreted protein n=1 Tax=Steinernema carpocapsae TaxID=34508 RepID=A0A4V6A690_STECR|nr:hypothetical protein L596_007893 [Steinernema carpocapsae]